MVRLLHSQVAGIGMTPALWAEELYPHFGHSAVLTGTSVRQPRFDRWFTKKSRAPISPARVSQEQRISRAARGCHLLLGIAARGGWGLLGHGAHRVFHKKGTY